jgi:hypothetical protein
MVTIVTRAGKGSPLTHNEVDANFTNLNTGKAETASPAFTGQVSIPDGTAAAPALTNTGDTNTGVFFPAADTVAITTGGSERICFDPTGAFGINGANYGTSGQVLTSGGSGAAPSWTTPAAGGGGGFEQVFMMMGA